MRRYMTLDETLKYTRLTASTLKITIEFGRLPYVVSGDDLIFDIHDVQKAMRQIRTDGLEPALKQLAEARIAEIDAANDAKREAAKDKPAEPVVLEVPKETIGVSAELRAAEDTPPEF